MGGVVSTGGRGGVCWWAGWCLLVGGVVSANGRGGVCWWVGACTPPLWGLHNQPTTVGHFYSYQIGPTEVVLVAMGNRDLKCKYPSNSKSLFTFVPDGMPVKVWIGVLAGHPRAGWVGWCLLVGGVVSAGGRGGV